MWPEVSGVLGIAADRLIKNPSTGDQSAVGFLRMLKMGRTQWLQDCPGLRLEDPAHPLWQHEFFSADNKDFAEWETRLLECVEREHSKKIAPSLEEFGEDVATAIRHDGAETRGTVGALDGRIQVVEETVQAIAKETHATNQMVLGLVRTVAGATQAAAQNLVAAATSHRASTACPQSNAELLRLFLPSGSNQPLPIQAMQPAFMRPEVPQAPLQLPLGGLGNGRAVPPGAGNPFLHHPVYQFMNLVSDKTGTVRDLWDAWTRTETYAGERLEKSWRDMEEDWFVERVGPWQAWGEPIDCLCLVPEHAQREEPQGQPKEGFRAGPGEHPFPQWCSGGSVAGSRG